MKCIVRNVAERADRYLQRRPLSTLACIIAFFLAAESLVLWGIRAAFDEHREATARPVIASPLDDV